MTWLTPIGFLGLIGLIVLIIIYIIKPNYQQKVISSTFIWRLSLKYRKKRLPINKLHNILLFLCQVLIITGMAAILARPFIQAEEESHVTERVAIIDASASMMAATNQESRFERAVNEVRALAEETLEQNGRLTVILAGEEASFVVQSAGAEFKTELYNALDKLTESSSEEICTFGEGDIDGAIKLAEQVTAENTDVEVLLYTDTQYVDSGKIAVKNMAGEREWNAAILDVRGIVYENYYRFEIDVACYGNVDADIEVFCDIYGVNEGKSTLKLEATARCKAGATETIVFANYNAEKPDATITEDVEVYSYEYAAVHVDEMDSFEYDNSFYLYGGEKPTLKIQYCSAMPNNYFATAMDVIRDRFGSRWDVDYTEVTPGDTPATEGFDVYIFEHEVPNTLPEDGLIILSNPNKVPSSTGLRLGMMYNCTDDSTLTPGDAHPLMQGIHAENIVVTRYTEITSYDGYTPLMYSYGAPVVMAKNEPTQKILVMTFSLNYSDFPMLLEFPLLLSNAFNYYIPSTMEEHVFNVNESIALNSRSEQLNVMGPKTEVVMTEFPGTVDLKTPGVYTVTQMPISGKEVVENFYVRIPAGESNTAAVEDALTNPYFYEEEGIGDRDLVFYFALALIALLFIEWWLQLRKQF